MADKAQNYINHVAVLLDASSSMHSVARTLVKVADGLIKHLAERSTVMDQETRVTVYTFSENAKCVIFDKDVLRLPSISTLYNAYGNTALVDAVVLSIEDQRLTNQKYGDHAFLTYVLTDGEDNRSLMTHIQNMPKTLANLRDNETVAVLVPDQRGVYTAKSFGFPAANIAVWDVSDKGMEEVGEVLRTSTESFMKSRVLGVRSSKNVFTTSPDVVNKATINAKKLMGLPRTDYLLLDVRKNADDYAIREWVTAQGEMYNIGKAYYQLTKTEIIQPHKQLAIQNIHSGRIYTGPQVRSLLGLPDTDIRVKPDANPEYRIYVQSTSINRKLVADTKLLLLK